MVKKLIMVLGVAFLMTNCSQVTEGTHGRKKTDTQVASNKPGIVSPTTGGGAGTASGTGASHSNSSTTQDSLTFSITLNGEQLPDGSVVAGYCATGQKTHFTVEKVAGLWKSSVRRGELGNGHISLYYPGKTRISTAEYNLPFETAQSTEEKYLANAFYFAHIALDSTSAAVSVDLHNLMHELEIVVQTDNLPDDLTINITGTHHGKLSLENGTVSVDKGDVTFIRPWNNAPGTYVAMILPQSTQQYKSGYGIMDITWDNGTKKMKNYAFPYAHEEFAAGGKTTITVPLENRGSSQGGSGGSSSGSSGGGSSGGSASPTPPAVINSPYRNESVWLYGVAEDFPKFPIGHEDTIPAFDWGDNSLKGQWVKSPQGLTEIRWTEGCGWYDVNKWYDSTFYSDTKLCWAAGTSNLLHWWFTHNDTYIKQYYAKHPDVEQRIRAAIPDFSYSPDKYSHIFDFFRKNFEDKGAWPTFAMDWFLTGKRADLPALRNPQEMENFPGFFPDVFLEKNTGPAKRVKKIMYESGRWPKKEQFNQVVLEAIEKRQAITFVDTEQGGLHALNLWGVEFGPDGVISHIYYCNNNPPFFGGDRDERGLILRREVMYDSQGYTWFYPSQSRKPEHRLRVISLTRLDLAQDIWEDALK